MITLLLAFLTAFVLTTNAQDGEPDASSEDSIQTSATTDSVVEKIAIEPPAEKAQADAPAVVAKKKDEAKGLHQVLKTKFIEGDPLWMTPVLLCLIIGLGLCIERIISISLAVTNVKKLLGDVEGALKSGDTDAAKEICRSTRGPIASIFYQGIDRANEGLAAVEKSIIAYGSVQMSLLEKGLVWISLFISLAPMLGFMGTVIGMIAAFDSIEQAGDINPALVARGIKVALLTTVFGLIVAIILQIFYNYIVTKIDDIVHNMEDSSISFVDIMVSTNTIKGN